MRDKIIGLIVSVAPLIAIEKSDPNLFRNTSLFDQSSEFVPAVFLAGALFFSQKSGPFYKKVFVVDVYGKKAFFIL